jgi:molybdenum cofactor cytidylyltransferase
MPEQRVFAVVLAAGESRRFGSTKQLAEFDGVALVAHAVRRAEAVCGDRTILVIGSDWQNVLAVCGTLRGFFVRNDNYVSGLASSIACGARSVAPGADAMLLTMADQPLITTVHLQTLIDAWRAAPSDIIVSEYAGTQGPPVIFPARYFVSLTGLRGEQGARPLLRDAGRSVQGITCDAAAIDIDSTEDLVRLERDSG